MKVTGEQIIDVIAERLNEEGIPPSDNEIVRRINELTPQQAMQLVTFGDIQDWHNERICKKMEEINDQCEDT